MNCLGTSNTGFRRLRNANTLCSFNGNLEDVVSTPIYVQSVYDAVRFHMNGNENRTRICPVYSGAAMWLHHQSGQRDPL